MNDRETEERETNRSKLALRRSSLIGDDDDTDHPDFDNGSWTSVLIVLVVLGLGVAMMLALSNQN